MDPPMIIEPVRAIPFGRRRCWERSRTENPIFEQGDYVEGKLEGGLRRNPEPMQSAATTSDSNPISGADPSSRTLRAGIRHNPPCRYPPFIGPGKFTATLFQPDPSSPHFLFLGFWKQREYSHCKNDNWALQIGEIFASLCGSQCTRFGFIIGKNATFIFRF